jgi:4-hydroxy-4-methyl-2-oxoglutarate aldolase
MQALLKELSKYNTPTVANAFALLGKYDPSLGFMGADVRSLTPQMGIKTGIAVTARLDTTSAGMDEPQDLFPAWLQMAEEASCNGEIPVIAVIEAVGPRPKHTVIIGDCMATLMRSVGVVGMVTNGSIRDIAGIRDVPLACWAYGLTPMHAALRWVGLNEPVFIDGVLVKPNDVIHADENGVIVLPPADLEAICKNIPVVVEKEARLFKAINEEGKSYKEFFGI